MLPILQPALVDAHAVSATLPPLPTLTVTPHPTCRMCVAIPVRNEATTLLATLDALTDQRDLAGQPLDPTSYEIIVLANNCTDHSAEVVRWFARHHPQLALHCIELELGAEHAHVGVARRMAMDVAYQRLMQLSRRRGVIATTDGDTRVRPTWVAATLHEIAAGADAVGGRIITTRPERAHLDHTTQLWIAYDVLYKFLRSEYEAYLHPEASDPWPRHYHHTGASLALTAEMYGRVGGLPPLRSGEDVALIRALTHLDARIRHSPLVQVETSTRCVGRAPGGMADTLQRWSRLADEGDTLLVEGAEAIEAQAHLGAQLRGLWQSARRGEPSPATMLSALATRLGINANWLDQTVRNATAFGALHDHVVAWAHHRGSGYGDWPTVPITVAIEQLRERVGPLRRRA